MNSSFDFASHLSLFGGDTRKKVKEQESFPAELSDLLSSFPDKQAIYIDFLNRFRKLVLEYLPYLSPSEQSFENSWNSLDSRLSFQMCLNLAHLVSRYKKGCLRDRG